MSTPLPSWSHTYLETVIANLINAENKLKALINAPDLSTAHRMDAVDALQDIGVSRQLLKLIRARQEEMLDEHEQNNTRAQAAAARRRRNHRDPARNSDQ